MIWHVIRDFFGFLGQSMIHKFIMNNIQKNSESRWFGHKQVSPDEKTGLVRGVFDSVADKYDVMNDIMSGGIHRLWKDRLIRQIRPTSGYSYLDVAGGTGDIAFRLRRKTGSGSNTDICVFDLNENMLRAGRDRAINRGWINDFTWMTGNAEALPFVDNSYDVYTISFGLRNVTHIDTALSEALRVLKPGGRFFSLEFSHVRHPVMERVYKLYSKNLIPGMGALIAKDRESYQYLIESIERFPDQESLAGRMEKAGFQNVRFTNLSGGIAAIHEGWKL